MVKKMKIAQGPSPKLFSLDSGLRRPWPAANKQPMAKKSKWPLYASGLFLLSWVALSGLNGWIYLGQIIPAAAILGMVLALRFKEEIGLDRLESNSIN